MKRALSQVFRYLTLCAFCWCKTIKNCYMLLNIYIYIKTLQKRILRYSKYLICKSIIATGFQKYTLTPDFALCISRNNVKLGIWFFLHQIYFTVYDLNIVLKIIPTNKMGGGGLLKFNFKNNKLTWNNRVLKIKKRIMW